MLISPPIPEMQLFKKIDLGQVWGQSSKSQSESNILSTHIRLVPCQSDLPFPRYSILKIWPWKSKVKVIAQGHKVAITPYRLISLLFHVDRPCHSWDTAISKFDVENSRSRSWVRSKLKVITWLQHSVDSHPFRSMSIEHPVPELWLFQNLTLKIKGQGHGWGHSSKSQGGSNILSTHIPFIPCQFGIPLLSYDFFQNLTLKFKGQGYGWGHSSKSQWGSNILSTNIPFVPCQSALPFLKYSIFGIWPWKSRVKIKWPWCCTTTGLDNSIELWMV